MISLILSSILTLSSGQGVDVHICTTEVNPICCPDPNHEELPISEYRPYNNVCEFSYGIDPDTNKTEDAISCGYGPCPQCACGMIYSPVCCNGVEYSNDCMADCKGQSGCTNGACPNTCPCTSEFRPVCCPEKGTEYSNPCGAVCDGLKSDELIACYYGTCGREETDCVCTMEYAPICCDGKDFANGCVARCDGIDTTQCTQRQCEREEICECTLDYSPVCCPSKPAGGHDQTYGNSCQARCERTETELLECYYGECPPCPCPMFKDAHCCNGIEYGNECEATCAKATGCRKGKCGATAAADDKSSNHDRSGDRNSNHHGEHSSDRSSDRNSNGDEQYSALPPRGNDDNNNRNSDNKYSSRTRSSERNSNSNQNSNSGDSSSSSSSSNSDGSNRDKKYNALPARDNDDNSNGNSDNKYSSRSRSSERNSNSGDSSRYSRHSHTQSSSRDTGNQHPAFSGNSVRDCACTQEWKPVCCQYNEPFSDIKEVTYGNRCEAQCDHVTDCVNGECQGSLCICTAEFLPVCCPRDNGQPGQQFSNACNTACVKSEAELIACYYGICEDNCACPFIEAPVCCNGKEFSNDCVAKCSGETDCNDGECPVPCPAIYEPQCCKGNQQYDNKCLADADGATGCESKTCEEPCACSYEYIAVCCDDETYGNKCQAECAGEDLVACTYGECDDDLVCDCKEKEDIVCCDGKEYKNKCLATCAGEEQKSCKKGKCKSLEGVIGAPQMKTNVNNDAYKYGFNINTLLLGCILIGIVSFVCIYYKRTDPAQFQNYKENITYDSDQ